jgi:hypothetical protein
MRGRSSCLVVVYWARDGWSLGDYAKQRRKLVVLQVKNQHTRFVVTLSSNPPADGKQCIDVRSSASECGGCVAGEYLMGGTKRTSHGIE